MYYKKSNFICLNIPKIVDKEIIIRFSNFKVTNGSIYNSDRNVLLLSFSQLLTDKNFNLIISILIIEFNLFDYLLFFVLVYQKTYLCNQ